MKDAVQCLVAGEGGLHETSKCIPVLQNDKRRGGGEPSQGCLQPSQDVLKVRYGVVPCPPLPPTIADMIVMKLSAVMITAAAIPPGNALLSAPLFRDPGRPPVPPQILPV